nr:hypothetical protein [Planosporangium mesophilum]
MTPRVATPNDLAERGGAFAITAEVADPEDDEPEAGTARKRPAATGGRGEPGSGRGEPGSGRGEPGGDKSDKPELTGDPAGPGRLTDEAQTERGLRGLVGGGSSQVSIGAALRARDAARPTEADLVAAEEELVIVRRGWVPREDLPPRSPRH